MIGCGEISQVAHIPALGFMSDFYRITYLCDVSADALTHCSSKISGTPPKTTFDPEELCSSPDVDVVFIANSTEYHAAHAILGLKHDKFVFIEKPMCYSLQDADAIIAAEKESKGTVMVGYMRRYALAFLDAIEEVGGMDKILYARVRGKSEKSPSSTLADSLDIIGPNAGFVSQSGTFARKFHDFKKADIDDKNAQSDAQMNQGLTVECGVPVDGNTRLMWMLLGGLGSHDLSVMREALGMPTAVRGASLGFPFWNALLQYPGFCVSYESGIDGIPRFDAHIEIYSQRKSVRVQYDSPYVKGLPTTMTVCEDVNGVYKETMVRKTYEDAYTLEFRELHALVTRGTPVKTTAADARADLEIFGMIMKAGYDGSFMTGGLPAKAMNGKHSTNGVNGAKA